MTLVEFAELAAKDSDDWRYELDEGELITLSPTARLMQNSWKNSFVT
jgi:hypothetical protein